MNGNLEINTSVLHRPVNQSTKFYMYWIFSYTHEFNLQHELGAVRY